MRHCFTITDDPSQMGRNYTRGHNLPIGWKADGACQRERAVPVSIRKGGSPSIWLVEPQEKYRLGDTTVTGEQLTEVALGECSMCPVQWDCTSFAVLADEPWGTWGVAFDDLEWLKRLPNPERFIRKAERDGRAVQFAVADAQRLNGPPPRNLVGLRP